jgi:RimJ/RimL family protein N-acetyltransferase
MNPMWILRTGRLLLTPVSGADRNELRALKADPLVHAVMLGGVRSAQQTDEDLAEDVIHWGAHGYGIWAVRECSTNQLVGLTGLQARPDGRGIALRFAFRPQAQGRGLAREAAGAALRYGHERAGLRRIVAVAREENTASRQVLGSIGMRAEARFTQNGFTMLLYASMAEPA